MNRGNGRSRGEFIGGAVSIECHGSDENTKASVAWMRGVLKGLKK